MTSPSGDENGEPKPVKIVLVFAAFEAGGYVFSEIADGLGGYIAVCVHCISLCCAAAGFFAAWHEMVEGKKAFNVWSLYGVVCVLLALIAYVVWRPLPPNPDVSSRPYLDPSLLIDSAASDGVQYHYEIVNTGNMTAYRIAHEDSGMGMIDIVTPFASERLPQELDPGQKMDITTPPVLPWKTNVGYFSKILVLSYDSYTAGMTNHFRKRFRFFGSSDLLKRGAIFHPDSSKSERDAAW